MNETSKKVLLISLAIIVLLGGCYIGYHKIYTNGYNDGVVKEQTLYKEQQDKAKADLEEKQKQADKDRETLNSKIVELKKNNSDLLSQLNNKQTSINKKVVDYEKTSEGVGGCFKPDSSGLRIINESFPSSN